MGSKRLKIIQWNARSLRSNRHSIRQLLFEQELDIALVCETWFRPTQVYKYKNFNVVRKDRDDGFGGVAIFLSKKIQYETISFTGNFNHRIEVCGVNITVDNKKIAVLSLYRPPNVKASAQDYINIFSQLRHDCLIGGDFNAHHEVWGSPMCSRDGSILIEALDTFQDLIIVNDGSATRINMPGQNKSAVDVTIMSAGFASSYSWCPLSDTYGSDHFPIQIVLNSVQIENFQIFPISKWSMKGVDWQIYRSQIEKDLAEIPNLSSANEMIVYLRNVITKAANMACKTVKPFSVKSQYPPWWDTECTTLVNSRKNAMKIYKANLTMANFLEYKKFDAQCRRLFQVKAKSSWEKFCSELNRQSTPTAIWNRVNRIKNSKSPHSLNESVVETLFHRIAPDYVPSPFFVHNKDYEQHVLLSPISHEELIANINTSKCSAPGVDGINYIMISNLPSVATSFLCSIYNRILIDGENCDQLKESLVIPIPKPNDPSTCRPISLMSCLMKTFERILKSRLEWWLEKNQLLPETQYGLRRGRGTIDCVSHLVTDIQINFSQNTDLSSLFLDISSAYDNVQPGRLHEKLLHMRVPLNFASTLVNLFINRTVVIRCSDKIIGPRSVHKGLPQGSVISPLLFNIYTQDFHSMDIDCNILQYADDFCIYTTGRTYEQCTHKLDTVMHQCNNYFWNQGLDLSPLKSAVVFFSRHRLPATDTIQLSDVLVPVHRSHTYLGVTLDSKLTWDEHINKTLTKCEKSLNILKAVNRRRWGADPNINLLFYRAYTRDIIDYGCFLYGSASNTRLKKLDRMQYKALRLVVGAF
nr:unnamed protein product [Callosobruchus analis]